MTTSPSTSPATSTATAEQKSFDSPDETRTFDYGLVDLIDIGDEPVVVVDWWGASNYAKH